MLSIKQHLNGLEIDNNRFCSCDIRGHLETNKDRQNSWQLWLVLVSLVSFLPAEIALGQWSHSLSLQADAGHLFSDISAFSLTLLANWLAQRPAAGHATFGHRRFEILAALINGFGLLAIASFIAWEAIERFQNPEPIVSLPLLLGAGLGLIINGLNLTLLHKHNLNDLNIRAAFLHIVADAISSLGILITAFIICWLKLLWIDPVISLLIAGFVGFSSIPVIQSSLEVLLEYAPRSINPRDVEVGLRSFPEVHSVEMLRIWVSGSGQIALCAHIQVELLDIQQRDRLQWKLQDYLIQTFGIYESTLQLYGCNIANLVPLHPLLKRSLISYIHEQPETKKVDS